ncbi:MAG TPA: sulfite exporter TauE/SafE family protein [Bacilli bacterium]
MEPWIAALGFFVGIMIGLTGVGGAALLTPVLILFHIHPAIAVGTDLFYNAVTKLFGVIRHFRQKTIRFRIVVYLGIGSLPGAAAAMVLLRLFDAFFHDQEAAIRHALGIMLIIAAALMLYRQFFRRREGELPHAVAPTRKKRLATIGIGFLLGLAVGFTSIGSGSLFALAIVYLYRLKGAEIVGTDLTHALFLVTAAGLMHAGLGNVDYLLAANLLVGSIPGVLLGSGLSAKVPTRPLKAMLATLILISGISLV